MFQSFILLLYQRTSIELKSIIIESRPGNIPPKSGTGFFLDTFRGSAAFVSRLLGRSPAWKWNLSKGGGTAVVFLRPWNISTCRRINRVPWPNLVCENFRFRPPSCLQEHGEAVAGQNVYQRHVIRCHVSIFWKEIFKFRIFIRFMNELKSFVELLFLLQN